MDFYYLLYFNMLAFRRPLIFYEMPGLLLQHYIPDPTIEFRLLSPVAVAPICPMEGVGVYNLYAPAVAIYDFLKSQSLFLMI